MDIEKLLKMGIDYFSDYFSVLISTLRKPALRFQPLPESNESATLAIPKNPSSYLGPKLNPKLIGFMIISIFIGSILNSVVFGQLSSDILIRNTIIILAVWFLYSLAIFGLCKILRGQGSFLETISVSLQLLATIYVVSNLALLLLKMIFLPILFLFIEAEFLDLLLHDSALFYYLVQVSLMFYYLPVALSGIHNFNDFQLFITLIVPLTFSLFAISSYIGILKNDITDFQDRPEIYLIPNPTPTATITPLP